MSPPIQRGPSRPATPAHEDDFRPAAESTEPTAVLRGTTVEIVRRPNSVAPRHVLFDFDGTLSLIREGWSEVMVAMMVEVLQTTGSGESAEQLEKTVRHFVAELTGKQTIYQMIRLAEEVERRGAAALDPLEYKRRYHNRLMERIEWRRRALADGRAAPRDMLVPGSLELLDELRRRGASLYLASGTDEPYVVEEVRLLRLEEYFGRHVYAARDDYRSFSKAMVIQRILADHGVRGEVLLGFGDGYVEIQNVKQAGGTAVGVASDEAARSGRPDPWKRDRLLGAGADVIVPDYRDWAPLTAYLWGETPPEQLVAFGGARPSGCG